MMYLCIVLWERQSDKNLQSTVNISSKVTVLKQSTLIALYEKHKATKLINDNTHILHNEYVLLPLFSRYRIIAFKINRKLG